MLFSSPLVIATNEKSNDDSQISPELKEKQLDASSLFVPTPDKKKNHFISV